MPVGDAVNVVRATAKTRKCVGTVLFDDITACSYLTDGLTGGPSDVACIDTSKQSCCQVCACVLGVCVCFVCFSSLTQAQGAFGAVVCTAPQKCCLSSNAFGTLKTASCAAECAPIMMTVTDDNSNDAAREHVIVVVALAVALLSAFL